MHVGIYSGTPEERPPPFKDHFSFTNLPFMIPCKWSLHQKDQPLQDCTALLPLISVTALSLTLPPIFSTHSVSRFLIPIFHGQFPRLFWVLNDHPLCLWEKSSLDSSISALKAFVLPRQDWHPSSHSCCYLPLPFAQTRLTSFLPLMLLPSSALCPDSLSNIFVNCLLCIPPSRCPCGWVSLEWPLWTRFCTFEILSLSNYYDYYHFSLKLLGSSYWAIQAGLLTPLTFARRRLSPCAAFTSGAYFLHNGRRLQWICEFYTANFKGIFRGP